MESLQVYLRDPLIEIDNNLVENAIRPTALGKKNWRFFGDADAGERSAVIYSIVESCRRHGIEPYSYLCDVPPRLPTMTNRQIKDIAPKTIASRRRPSAPPYFCAPWLLVGTATSAVGKATPFAPLKGWNATTWGGR